MSSVSEVLRGDDVRTWGKTVDLDAIERDDEFLRFTAWDAVGRDAGTIPRRRPAVALEASATSHQQSITSLSRSTTAAHNRSR
jgi:hypothetical protein